MTTLRAGVIGLGVGEQHVAGYQRAVDCEVVAVCDLDEAKLADVADRYGIARRHTDHLAITEDPDIDVVSICSWDDAHARQAVSALANGKHVMVEKPVALTPAEAAEVAAAQRSSGRLLTSNLILRAEPRFIELKQRIERGELGDLFYVEGDYLHRILHKITEGWRGRMPGYSVIYGGGIHLVDLLRWLVGDEVEEVVGMGTDLLARSSPFPHEDTTVTLLRFRNGVLGKVTSSFATLRPKLHALSIHGTAGSWVNDVPDAWLHTSEDRTESERITTPYPGTRKGDLLPAFIDAIRAGTETDVTATDVLRVADVCFAASEAVRSGRTVRVDYTV